MKAIYNLSKTEGKTIIKAGSTEHEIVLHFEDGTYLYIQCMTVEESASYDLTSAPPLDSVLKNPQDWGIGTLSELFKLKFINETLYQEALEKQKKHAKDFRYKEYLKLKEEFEE